MATESAHWAEGKPVGRAMLRLGGHLVHMIIIAFALLLLFAGAGEILVDPGATSLTSSALHLAGFIGLVLYTRYFAWPRYKRAGDDFAAMKEDDAS